LQGNTRKYKKLQNKYKKKPFDSRFLKILNAFAFSILVVHLKVRASAKQALKHLVGELGMQPQNFALASSNCTLRENNTSTNLRITT